MSRTPEQPVGNNARVSRGTSGKGAGDSLERALQTLSRDGTVAVFHVDEDGVVLCDHATTTSIAILSRTDGFPLDPSDHPLQRFHNNSPLVRERYRLLNDSGEARTIELSAQHPLFIAVDVTEPTQLVAKLHTQSETDEYTGALNYRGLIDRLTKSLHRARPINDRVAVLAISLDGYRLLSESLASDIEPMVVREVAKRLKTVTREDELVAYLGGDRFIVVIHQVANEPDAISAAERIRRSVNSPIKFGRRELRVSASIGVAFNGRRSENAADILRNATLASQAARLQGENDWAVFDDAMRSRSLNNMRAEDMVDNALRSDAFAAEFQPIVAAKSRTILGFETLARIRSNDGLSFSPTSFISAAERSGRITPLDRRVLDLAGDQAKRLESLPGSYRVTVNISTHSALRPDLYSMITDSIEEHRINPKSIALELREEAFLEAGTATKAAFSELEHDGVALLLDGYGAGRIGMNFLAEFSLKAIKLHMSFVQGATTSSRDRSVIAATVANAHALDMAVIAAGVETTEQAAILTDLGCDQLQGYVIGRPTSGHDAEALVLG